MTTPATITLGDAHFAVSALDLPIKGQDRLLARDGFAGVADGATPVAPGPRDVGLFAADALAAIADHELVSLRQAVRCAIREVGHLTEDRAATPSAALAIAQARDDHLELGVLGDCLAIVRLRDGSTLVAPRDPALLELDRLTAAAMGEVLQAGLAFAIARLQVADRLVAQRRLMNRPGGYWIFAAEPDAADHLLEAAVPLASVESFLLCSDGFARLWDGLGAYVGPAELLDATRDLGLPEMGRLLREAEAADDPPLRSPRVSVRDDASALLLERL